VDPRRPDRGAAAKQPAAATAPLRAAQVSALFALPVSLREHAFWQLLYDSGAPPGSTGPGREPIDLARHRVGPFRTLGQGLGSGMASSGRRRPARSALAAGRADLGPVFVTDRKAPRRP